MLWNRFKPSSKIFTDWSKAVLLWWIFYGFFFLSYVCYAFVRICLYVPCGHLLGKGWPLGSRLWCLTVSWSLSHWYFGSGVVLDCIHSWSLHPYLLSHKILESPPGLTAFEWNILKPPYLAFIEYDRNNKSWSAPGKPPLFKQLSNLVHVIYTLHTRTKH